jgi:hypothetical protein
VYYAETDGIAVSDYGSKSVGNTECPHCTSCWHYLKTASFQDGDTLGIMHQGGDASFNQHFSAQVIKCADIYLQNGGTFARRSSM